MHSLAEFTLPASNRAAGARFWGVNSNSSLQFISSQMALFSISVPSFWLFCLLLITVHVIGYIHCLYHHLAGRYF
jgi:ABC-type dipeptide/oligopeptide/nickel transport system permease component